MFALVAKSSDYHIEGFQVLRFVCELEAEAATYTIAVTDDFVPFNSRHCFIVHSLATDRSSRLLSAKTGA